MQTFLNDKVFLHGGDSREVLRGFESNSIDSVVCDPPYALISIVKRFGGESAAPANNNDVYARASSGFMGKQWDTGETAFAIEFWQEVYRVLKPGGHVAAFSGTRSYHRLACAIEDAGFEIRDQLAWLYGCLDDKTSVATRNGIESHDDLKAGDDVLCYNIETGEYSYQPIIEVVEYEYADTAFRLIGDFGEQVVSRNHRCIVERDGIEVFQFAETWEHEARVPILEDLSKLQEAVLDAEQGTSASKKDMLSRVQEITVIHSEKGKNDTNGGSRWSCDSMRGLPKGSMEADRMADEGIDPDMQPCVQWSSPWRGVEDSCTQRSSQLDGKISPEPEDKDDGQDESCMEGWVDLPPQEGSLLKSVDQIHSMSNRVLKHGPEGRLCYGTQADGCDGIWSSTDTCGGRPPHQSQRNRQSNCQSDVVRHERTAQSIRAWSGHKAHLVRIVPFHYVGKMWCLRVPTGAFVAVRGGVAFPTGNSGFPKSHSVSKAIDKSLGAEREKVRIDASDVRNPKATGGGKDGMDGATRPWIESAQEVGYHEKDSDDPATPQPAEWQGWGTALKPAWEPICLARKPLNGTVAANVLEHGTGALNIDGCRVGTDEMQATSSNGVLISDNGSMTGGNSAIVAAGTKVGRWPANICHDGSDEVVALFPSAKAGGNVSGKEPSKPLGGDVFGQGLERESFNGFGDTGSAARFFYSAKADKQDRIGSKHPTVKPLNLMSWLCRLITPPGGTILDPFAGSGSTGEAAWREGFTCHLIEREEEYQADIAERMRLADKGKIERKQRAIKQVASAGPLFGDVANDNGGVGKYHGHKSKFYVGPPEATGGQTDIRQVRGSTTGLSVQSA